MRLMLLSTLIGCVMMTQATSPAAEAPKPPNILFIAIDDQNDWIGHLGGHPLIKTPHLDALAARGTTFKDRTVNGTFTSISPVGSSRTVG
jgi:hypothetical protein